MTGFAKNFRIWAWLASLLFVVACASTPTKETPPAGPPRETIPVSPPTEEPAKTGDGTTITIGVLLPLSGSYGQVGHALLNASTMALFDIRDSRLQLLPLDTRGTPEGAAEAAQIAIDKGAQVILGPLLGPAVRAAASVTRASGIPMIGFSTDRSVAGDNVYLLSFLPEAEIERIIAYAASRGYSKFAAMIPETPYGETILPYFGQTALAWHGEVVDIQVYQPDTSQLFDPVKTLANYDHRHQELLNEKSFLESFGEDDFAHEILSSLEKIETLGEVSFDAVLLPEGAALLRAMAPLFPYYDADPDKIKFLGTGLWNDLTLLREPQLTGGWFAAPDPDRSKPFFDRYAALYTSAPPRITTLGYDAVALLATLAYGNPDLKITASMLTDRSGFTGLDGIFRFRSDGTTERGLVVLEVKKNGFKVISSAPTSFAGFEELMTPPPPPPPVAEAIPGVSINLSQQPAGNGVEERAPVGSHPDDILVPDKEALSSQVPQ